VARHIAALRPVAGPIARPKAYIGRELLCGMAIMALAGCQEHSTANTVATVSTSPAAATPVAEKSSFDGDRAYGFLKDQCDFGPRVPETPAHEQCRAYIGKQLKPYVDTLKTQAFTFKDRERHKTLALTNILGIINPGAKRKIMLFTHWDTRPTADQELEPADRRKPIIGADDGASGTAVLLELARVFHDKKPDVCVELLFVDGEDWGPGEEKMYLGAIQFAKHPGQDKPEYAILLDMIGDKELTIHRERTSEQVHPELNDKVWTAAAALGYQAQFPNDPKYQISDDHNPFNVADIPAIDLIDFDYAYWHTLGDTADKCDARSLKAVGDVMAKVVYDEK
jgi:glutaminyl-peptide cyclotransferase